MKNYREAARMIFPLICFSIFAFAANLHAAEYKIRVANPVAADHSWGRAAVFFKQEVEKNSNGKIAVQVVHAGSLGKVGETLEMLKAGSLETTVGGVANFQSAVPELGITVLPYLWKDIKRQFEVLNGPAGKEIEKRMLAAGFYSLGFWDNGFRNISNNRKPIHSPDDLKDLKIRTLPTPVHTAFFKACGAVPTPMDFAQLFPALKSGVVDAQENPPSITYTSKLYEVQKYYSLTGHFNEVGAFIMSRNFYSKLPTDLQAVVDDAARKTMAWQWAENEKDNLKYLEELKKAGMQVNTLSDEELARFRKIARDLYPEAVKDFGKDSAQLMEMFVKANEQ